MKWSMLMFGLVVVQSLLLALEVYLAITNGGAFHWAVTTLVGVMLVVTLINYAKVSGR